MASSERTTEVRRGHEVNVAKLKAYLDTSAASDLPGYHRAMRLEVKQFNAGQSNPTFLLTLSGQGNLPLRCVLRKRPGDVKIASAHNVEREFRVLRALRRCGGIGVPVPEVFHLFTARDGDGDPTGLGVDWYLMEFVDGEIFDDPALPQVPRARRAAYYRAAVAALAALHAVPLEGGLSEALGPQQAAKGPSSGYFARQLRRLVKVSDKQSEDAPPVDGLGDLAARLATRLQSTSSGKTGMPSSDRKPACAFAREAARVLQAAFLTILLFC